MSFFALSELILSGSSASISDPLYLVDDIRKITLKLEERSRERSSYLIQPRMYFSNLGYQKERILRNTLKILSFLFVRIRL